MLERRRHGTLDCACSSRMIALFHKSPAPTLRRFPTHVVDQQQAHTTPASPPTTNGTSLSARAFAKAGETPPAPAPGDAPAASPLPIPPRPPGRPVWQCKPLAVDEASHAANVAAVKGGGIGSGVGGGGGLGGWMGRGAGGGSAWGSRGRSERATVRLGIHWAPAMQLIHHRGIQVRGAVTRDGTARGGWKGFVSKVSTLITAGMLMRAVGEG